MGGLMPGRAGSLKDGQGQGTATRPHRPRTNEECKHYWTSTNLRRR